MKLRPLPILVLIAGLAAAASSRAQGLWHLDKCSGGGFMGWELAIDYCTRAIKSGDLSTRGLATAYYNRGNAWSRHGNPERALRDVDEAIRLEAIGPEPDDLRAMSYNLRGAINFSRRNFDGALADFNQAIRLDARLGDAYLRRAQTWLAKGEADRAIADFSLALKLDAPDKTSFSGGGTAYAGRPRNFDRSLQDSIAYHGRGVAYLQKKDPAAAMAEFDEALRVNPRSAPALKSRAQLYEQRGEHERAVLDYTNALQVNPRDAAARIERGRIRSLQGEFAAASIDFDEALKLDPRHHNARLLRAFIALGDGRYEQASEDLGVVMQHARPQAPLALWRHVARARAAADPQALASAREELARDNAKVAERTLHSQLVAFYLQPGDAAALHEGRSASERCAVDFFLAQHHLIAGDKARGAALLGDVARQCPASMTENWVARLELARLNPAR